MEQSDNILITTLKEFISIPQQIITLKDIKGDQIFQISLTFLSYLQIDTQEIKNLSKKSQKFRSMAKLNQNLYEHLQTQFQLNELMNPSLVFLRKFLLVLINKLSSLDTQQKKGKKSNQYFEEKTNKQEKNILKSWTSQEWIHPALLTKPSKYRAYLLPATISKNLLKNNTNLSDELSNNLLGSNVQAILNLTVAKHHIRVRQFEANEGISRRENEEAQINTHNIVKANRSDWNIAQNRMKKIKNKLHEEQQSSSSIIQAPSIFQKEVLIVKADQQSKKVQQKQTIEQTNVVEEKEPITIQNTIQRLKRQAEQRKKDYEMKIKEILAELKFKKQIIDKWEEEKASIQNKITNDEQKTLKIKSETIQLKKKVQKRQTILNSVEGDKDVESEVKKLEEEIGMIEGQAKEEFSKIRQQIKEMQDDSKMKMDALNDLKLKLAKIQNDYSNICEQITEKEELKGGVKIMKSGVSRLYYSKKISEMESRWRQTQKDIRKIKINLEQVREKTRISGTLNQRLETQIQNILNMDKNKNEAQNKILKNLMAKCRESYENTKKILQKINEVKMQTQEYEMKVHGLSGKNYKQNIQKINFALQDLRRQMGQIKKQ